MTKWIIQVHIYELRAELATKQLDFDLEINKFKLGRALYHIAQRRGFKSSKGETLKGQKKNETEIALADEIESTLKKSEKKVSDKLGRYISANNLPTIGCGFFQLEKENSRIRGGGYRAVRSQYREEIKYIFKFQEQLDDNSDFFKRIYSDKKDGCIFYKRPLRSQKGLVGKCALEPAKYRCPISHPEFEKFRAFEFINKIRYQISPNNGWKELTVDQKLRLFNEKFLLKKLNFKFKDIRVWLQKNFFQEGKLLCNYNYEDGDKISTCPISVRLKNLLGEDWENFSLQAEREHPKTKEKYIVNYSMEDIWHICFSYNDREYIEAFAKNQLKFDDKQTESLVDLWDTIPQGYSRLSLKAIWNINRFLVPDTNKEGYKGLIYPRAVLLAKIPEILGEELWVKKEQLFLREIDNLIEKNRSENEILKIVNCLIAYYKLLPCEKQYAFKNTEYKLDDSNFGEVEKYAKEHFGEKGWEEKNDRMDVFEKIKEKYQDFFSSSQRNYYKLLRDTDIIKGFLSGKFDFLQCANDFVDLKTGLPCQCDVCKKVNKLYHPSVVGFYKPAKEKNGVKLLGSPAIGAFKNPMAMRTLHELKKLVNYLIKKGKIDEETRVVVEIARDLNDANMRWAIKTYQDNRKKENEEFEKLIKKFFQNENRSVSDEEIDKVRLLLEQCLDDKRGKEMEEWWSLKKESLEGNSKKGKKLLEKYRLWLEQGMKCMYTGKIINLSDLLSSNNVVEIEHTIPRSQSFDDSLQNKTICFTDYNRFIKKNQIPTQLPNYSQDTDKYPAIEPRLKVWKEKVCQLEKRVRFWGEKSEVVQTKDEKDKLYATVTCGKWNCSIGELNSNDSLCLNQEVVSKTVN